MTQPTLNEKYQATIDKYDIIEVSTISFCCRDTGDWDKLATCFDPEAPITTSWFKGTAREFAAQSKSMMDGHHTTDTQRHMMANARVTLNGNRAVCEYYLILHQGRTLDGYEFDLQTWSVTLDLFEKRDGKWLICKRKMIYEKSRMDPRMPGSVPQSYFEQLDLSRYPAAVKFHCYRNEKSSGHVPKNLILKGSAEEKAARVEAEQWVAGAR
jgi:hypothetical protein